MLWLILTPVLLLAILGVVIGTQRSNGPVADVEEKPIAPPTQPGQYPEPGDPEFADYREMLRQPEYQLSVSNSPGFRIPYDPEWRSMRTGHREVATHDRPLSAGGARSLDELGQDVLFGLTQMDEEVLRELQITHEDFVKILWPEMPQSRPALSIPADEAWFFQGSKIDDGLNKMAGAAKERRLKFEAVQVTQVIPYTNYRLLEVRIFAQDASTGETVDITGEKGATVAERLGVYKFYLFRN